MKFITFLAIIFCIDVFSCSNQEFLGISQVFNNKLLYHDLSNFDTEDDYFKLKIIKILKKIKKSTGYKIFTLILTSEIPSNNHILNSDLFDYLIRSKKLNVQDSLICVDKIKGEYIFSSNQKILQTLFKKTRFINSKDKFKKDLKIGGYEYATYSLLKEIYSLIPKRILSNYKIKINSKMDTERDNMLKSLFILPVIFLLCYSYIFGYSKEKDESLVLKPSRLEKIGLNEIYEKSCLICLEDFLKKKTLSFLNHSETEVFLLIKEKNLAQLVKLECGHIFHPTCLNKWLKTQQKCPTCRNEIKSNSSYNFYMIEELE
jgi:hypothetical protein